jgi:cytochrome c5
MSKSISAAAICAVTLFSMSALDARAAYSIVVGKAVYTANCAVCHKDGIAGAPKLGNKTAWAPRIKQGVAVLISKSIKGFQGKVGVMPPKGGNVQLTDQQIGDAVYYIVSESK